MTVLLIYLTAPQLFSFMWTRASWNLGWVNVRKTFQKSMHFLLPSLWVTEIHGHLFSRVSGLYHYFLLYLSLPESLKYMVIYFLRFWDFIVISSCTWVTEKHGHLFSGVLGLYCHILLYLSHWNTWSFVLWGLGALCHFLLYLDLLLFLTSFCLFLFMFKIQDCQRTVLKLKLCFENTPAPFPLGSLTHSASPYLQIAWLHSCKVMWFQLF